ncbi:MAG: endonuclease Q family protein [Candidatus Methanomethyliaceae archaeon]|nr:endonuclease Q family protein [Candidatus Methanomethyliaceae archaeon]
MHNQCNDDREGIQTRIVADLHIHSPYSRATSKDMTLKNLDRGASIKGIKILGTGDFTHPKWREALKNLREEDGLYRIEDSNTRFIVTGEVCTNFKFGGKTRRIHHLILLPSLEVAEQICERLSRYGDLEADGRPNLSMTGAQLVEEIVEFGEECLVIPAHIWTPWFSLFGDRGGVDRIEECYEDQTPHIYALETGLSSDPPMNWRVSALDSFTLVSNSDSHSPSPWRLGREANIIEVQKLSYSYVVRAIMEGKDRITTIEVDPAYGKYHWTGHRICNIALPPYEAIKLKGICPVCGKKMTKGVAERVEELADRPEGEGPKKKQNFLRVLPLSDIIATYLGKDPFSAEVQRVYWDILKKFSNELQVLLETPIEELEKVCGIDLAKLLIMNRENRINIIPGYDGVYGKIEINGDMERVSFLRRPKNLEDYINNRKVDIDGQGS